MSQDANFLIPADERDACWERGDGLRVLERGRARRPKGPFLNDVHSALQGKLCESARREGEQEGRRRGAERRREEGGEEVQKAGGEEVAALRRLPTNFS